MDVTRPKASPQTLTARTSTSSSTNKSHYQIEYWNKMWRDWLGFNQLFYKTEEDAQKRIDEYKESIPDIKTRIVQTTILVDKPKRYRKKKDTKVTTEPVTRPKV